MAKSKLDMSNWTVSSNGMTLAQAFGVDKGTIDFPKFTAKLPVTQGAAGGSASNTKGGSAPSGGGGGKTGSSGGKTSGGGITTGGGGSPSANAALGKQMTAAVGWTGSQWNDFNNVVMAESGWNAFAANPTSNARGIAQKISGWSSNYQPGNARQQIAWMIAYIKGRYGTPANAWAHERAFHWY